MLEFKRVEESNINLIVDYFKTSNYRTCDYTALGILMWSDYFKNEFAIQNNVLYLKGMLNNTIFFSVPFAEKMCTEEGIEELKKYCLANKVPLNFRYVPSILLECLKIFLGDGFTFNVCEACFDYVYDMTHVISLSGKKYSGQRNHINKFLKSYPNYSFEEMSENNIEEVKQFMKEYIKVTPIKSDWMALENNLSTNVVNHFINYQKYGALGGLIRVNGRVVAISIGEIIQDTLYIHIEKGLREYEGVYQIINNLFAKHFFNPSILYVNREEDDGDLGLRKAKMDFNPMMILEKYHISQK